MKRIMIDKDKCEACLGCGLACMQAHREDAGTIYDLRLTDPANVSRNRITADRKGGIIPMFCRHCSDPKCVKACMSGAMSKDAGSGHILYNEEKCAACFMCVMNCPYGVLKPDRAKADKVVKCDFCLDNDSDPQCVKACPMKAIRVEEVAL